MIIPADFDWRTRWPVGTRLILGHLGPAVVTEHREIGPIMLCVEPYRFGAGEWRKSVAFEDIRMEAPMADAHNAKSAAGFPQRRPNYQA